MDKFATAFDRLARVAFAGLIITLPWRLRLVLVSRPIEPVYRDYSDLILFAPDAFMLATLAFWLASLFLERRRVNPGPFFISIPLLGLTLAAVASSFFSFDPTLSFYHSIRLFLLDGLYLFVLNEIRSLAWVTVPLALQILIQSAVGLEQVYQQHSLGLQRLGEYELDPTWSGVSVVFANGIRILRAYGLTDHPNILGGCLALGMILRAARFGQARLRAQLLTAFVLIVGSIALLFTFSRAAYFALAVGLVFSALVLWRTRPIESLKRYSGLLSITVLFVLPFAYQNAAALGIRAQGAASASEIGLEIRSVAERTALNSAAVRIFNDRPIAGLGIGALPEGVRAYYPNFEFYPQPAHIALLDAAAETGLFGALFYLALLLAPWIALAINRARVKWTTALIGTSAVLLAVTVIGFFDYYTWLLVPGRLWQWTAWGLWSAAYQNSLEEGC